MSHLYLSLYMYNNNQQMYNYNKVNKTYLINNFFNRTNFSYIKKDNRNKFRFDETSPTAM